LLPLKVSKRHALLVGKALHRGQDARIARRLGQEAKKSALVALP
jgi:hypothetical protein